MKRISFWFGLYTLTAFGSIGIAIWVGVWAPIPAWVAAIMLAGFVMVAWIPGVQNRLQSHLDKERERLDRILREAKSTKEGDE